MGVAAEPAGQDGIPPAPASCPVGWWWGGRGWGDVRVGGADRETGRKPLRGSIVLEMNRGAFFLPLCVG